VAGLGAGFPPAAERAELTRAHESGIAVCLARRTAGGRTVGAEDTAPFLSAGRLSALQARLAITVALADDRAPTLEELQTLLSR
jgi:L-asparaginase/Glu-tRNA(Gln) amidotransferase subunit D